MNTPHWSWILNLVPIGSKVISLLSRNRRNKELKEEVTNEYVTAFNAATSQANKDLKLIANWKKYIAPLHGINSVILSFETLLQISQIEKKPELAFKIISSDKVEMLLNNAENILKEVDSLFTINNIVWEYNAIPIENEFISLVQYINSLKRIVQNFENRIKAKETISLDSLLIINHELEHIKEAIYATLNYWNGFLESLVINLNEAPKVFAKDIPNITDKAIDTEYDETKLDDVLNDVQEILKSIPSSQS